MNEPVITHVSDTARWIAAYRAIESRRPDALFRDPFADRLAGTRGHAIVAKAPLLMARGGMVIARTKLIDDLVLDCVRHGADLVLNLAAGLDTRPYRLPLPESLRWVEVDLPGLIAEKETLLLGERPACQLTRESADLTDPKALAALLDRLAGQAKRIAVIAEGLLMYLPVTAVDQLTCQMARHTAIRWWILSLNSSGAVNMLRSNFGQELGGVVLHFAPRDGVAYFEHRGWEVTEVFQLVHAARRLRRGTWWLRQFARFMPEGDPRNPPKRWGAVVRLVNSLRAD
ncbi:MAG: SAM-dependent methyltransferase [Opitutaceae bacterium]|jgi:methyltransferase (TIGR00027 family)